MSFVVSNKNAKRHGMMKKRWSMRASRHQREFEWFQTSEETRVTLNLENIVEGHFHPFETLLEMMPPRLIFPALTPKVYCVTALCSEVSSNIPQPDSIL